MGGNGFEHDPTKSVEVRVRMLKEAAASGELFVLAMNEAKTDGWLYLGAGQSRP